MKANNWVWVSLLHVQSVIDPVLHLSPGGCGELRSPASPWLVLWPAPAHACNAVCNEKSKHGTAVRHDRNVFPLEGAPCKKKRRKRIREKLRQSWVQKECSFGPRRKTNVIVHWLSLCQPSLTNWFPVPLPVSPPPRSLWFPKPVFAQVDSDTVLNEPQSSPSARMAVDCVIDSESRGACREFGVEAPTWGSLWMGRNRKQQDKHWEEQRNGGKMQRTEGDEWCKQREDRREGEI